MKPPWYIEGLHFECRQCGNCCSGPDEGYIWLNRTETELLAAHLKTSVEKLCRKYLKRVGMRSTITEQPVTNDCVFLRKIDGRKKCIIYPVRPAQCRTWPFWPGNLKSPDAWNQAAQKCPGINRGKLYSFEEIEKIRSKKK